MNILVIGSGGREHALVWKLHQSPSAGKLYCAPGNPGIGSLAELVPVPVTDQDALVRFARTRAIDLTVVGPEQPLADGIVDRFEQEGLRIFGPSREASRLEWSKSFAKEFMLRMGIPTAASRTFADDALAAAEEFLASAAYPLVLKADGLAAGKGVLVCNSSAEGLRGAQEIMKDRVFGAAGSRLLVEEFLVGVEASVFAISDGERAITLIPAQDYKRAHDGDAGKNTGGMGAYAPSPRVSNHDLDLIRSSIIDPVIRGMREAGTPYRGCLYAGLMMTEAGPKVVEFNSRFGDPETQVVLPLIQGDFGRMLADAAAGDLAGWDHQGVPDPSTAAAVCVVLASKGYPEAFEKGKEISGLDEMRSEEHIIVFHSGTSYSGKRLVTSGGRVLGVTAYGIPGGLEGARKAAYAAARGIRFDGMHYRRDIADRVLEKAT